MLLQKRSKTITRLCMHKKKTIDFPTGNRSRRKLPAVFFFLLQTWGKY